MGRSGPAAQLRRQGLLRLVRCADRLCAAVQEWATLDPERDWREWWRPGAGVRYVQFLAKDNVPFHTISFPATIIGSGEAIRLVDRIKGFNWLNYGGDKFSTSQRRGIFTDAALEAHASAICS